LIFDSKFLFFRQSACRIFSQAAGPMHPPRALPPGRPSTVPPGARESHRYASPNSGPEEAKFPPAAIFSSQRAWRGPNGRMDANAKQKRPAGRNQASSIRPYIHDAGGFCCRLRAAHAIPRVGLFVVGQRISAPGLKCHNASARQNRCLRWINAN